MVPNDTVPQSHAGRWLLPLHKSLPLEARSRRLGGPADIFKLPASQYSKAKDAIEGQALMACFSVTEATHKSGINRWYYDGAQTHLLAQTTS